MTWNDSTQVLSIAPDQPSYAGKWTILGTYTPTNGSASQFTVVTLTVDCVVTSFTRPANPTTGLTYNLWDATALSFDFTQTWVQVPACGHAFTDSFEWSGTNTYVVQDTSRSGRINVSTGNKNAIGTHTVTLSNSPTVTANGVSGSSE